MHIQLSVCGMYGTKKNTENQYSIDALDTHDIWYCDNLIHILTLSLDLG